MTRNVQSLWLWVLVILHALAGLAAAQPQTDSSALKPTAAKPDVPASAALDHAASTAESLQPAAASGEQAVKARSPLETGVVRLLAREHDALGRRCELQDSAAFGALRLLACGPAGMWIVRLTNEVGDSAVLVSQQDLAGRVERFFQADGRLWVEIDSVHAQEVRIAASVSSGPQAQAVAAPPVPAAVSGSTAPAAPTAPQAQPAPTESEASGGKILSQTDEELLVGLTGLPARPRDHVALIGVGRDDEPNEQRIFAVGEVTRSWQDGRARVALGINEVVPPSATARVSTAPVTAATFVPPRAAGVWELGFLARPFLVLENLGVGAMLDGYVGYRGRAPFHVQASLEPLAFGTARAGAVGAAGAFISGAYDSRLFEVGLGVGAQTVNIPGFTLSPGSGVLLEQQLRIGARDGANLSFQSYVSLFHSNFQFSSLRVEAQIPLGARTWMRLAGGGGTLGFHFGEIGLRLLLSGNGGPDSFFFTTVAGWANLVRNCSDVPPVAGASAAAASCTAVDYSGPMLGAGGEFRL